MISEKNVDILKIQLKILKHNLPCILNARVTVIQSD